MKLFSKTSIRPNGETYFGIEITAEGNAVYLSRLAKRLF